MTEFLRFRINVPKVIHETIEGETVLVNLDSGNYYSLDGVGADVCGLIGRGVNGRDIVEWLAGRYRGERVEIEKAFYELISDMQREELIVLDGDGSENIMDQGGDEKGSSHEQLKNFVPPILHKYTDMQDLLLLDPIHEVDETGWPSPKTDPPING